MRDRCAGEGALYVPKQFAFDQRAGTAAQLTATNGPFLRAVMVKCLGDQFFAGAVFAQDQHRASTGAAR